MVPQPSERWILAPPALWNAVAMPMPRLMRPGEARSAAHAAWRAAEERLAAARAAISEAERDREWLEHCVAELQALNPQPGEEAELAEARPGDSSMEGFQGPYAYMMAIRKPVIAAINGPAAGLGFAIPLFADMRFASDRAIFTTAFAQRGLIAEWGIGWNLPRLIGPAHALDLLLSARKIDAAEALRMGLVNQVLPHDELIPFVHDYVKHLADTVSPASMAVIKRQVWENLEKELDPALRESVELMKQSFDRPDFKEGVQSFLEKRLPKFARIKL